MCIKFWYRRKKQIYKPIIYTTMGDDTPSQSSTSPSSSYACSPKQPTGEEGYYSPYCRKRPFSAQRVCINCKKVFYNYKKITLCSKECSISYFYKYN